MGSRLEAMREAKGPESSQRVFDEGARGNSPNNFLPEIAPAAMGIDDLAIRKRAR